MLKEELIDALAQECRLTPIKIEDLLRALADLAAETLERGEQFFIPDLGRFDLRPYMEHSRNRARACVTFHAVPELRARLKLVDLPERSPEPCPSCRTTNPGMCEDCKVRKRHVAVYKKCKSCIGSQTRRNREADLPRRLSKIVDDK